MTIVRTLPGTFTNATDLPFVNEDLPVAGALRRYLFSTTTEAVDTPILSVANRGTADGGLTAAGSSTAPTKRSAGGRIYGEFDGVNDVLACATSDASAIGGSGLGALTMYVVGRIRSLPPSGAYWPITTVHPNNYFGITFMDAGKPVPYRGNLPAVTLNPGTTWHVFIAVLNGTSSVMRMDGTEQTGLNSGSPIEAVSSMSVGKGPSASQPAIDVAEVGLYSGVLDATQRATLATHLMDLHNIT